MEITNKVKLKASASIRELLADTMFNGVSVFVKNIEMQSNHKCANVNINYGRKIRHNN